MTCEARDAARIRELTTENQRLREALATVRHEICVGPVDDVLWHRRIPAETTVDFICNVLRDDWDYDAWLAKHGPECENRESQR